MLTWLKQKYGKRLTVGVIVLLGLPIILWLVSLLDNPISTGEGLTKADWLSFLGSYLAFLGTIVVAVISLAQAGYYKHLEEEREFRTIQPIISVDIIARHVYPEEFDSNVERPDITFFMDDEIADRDDDRHNVYLKVRNASDKVARNVAILEAVIFPVIESHQSKKVVVSFDEVDDDDRRNFQLNKVKVVTLDGGETSDGFIPDYLSVRYDDELGNTNEIIFELLEDESGRYYSQKSFSILNESKYNYALKPVKMNHLSKHSKD